jgi:hypothetical protein
MILFYVRIRFLKVIIINNDLFFGVFIILVKNSGPASLLRLRKLSSQIDILMLPFAKARCELVSNSN